MDAALLAALRAKHDDLQRQVETYQRKLASLGTDLANMRAVLSFHEQHVEALDFLPHMSVRRLFKRDEIFSYCREAFAAAGESLDTRELARFVIGRKGLDPNDAVLRKKIVFSIMQVMRTACRRRLVVAQGKRKGVRLWARVDDNQKATAHRERGRPEGR